LSSADISEKAKTNLKNVSPCFRRYGLREKVKKKRLRGN
jgi:hypothetical protein